MSNGDSKMVRYTPPPGGRVLTPEDRERLEKLAAMPDEDIDLSDIPEITDEQWATRRSAQEMRQFLQDRKNRT